MTRKEAIAAITADGDVEHNGTAILKVPGDGPGTGTWTEYKVSPDVNDYDADAWWTDDLGEALDVMFDI